MSKPLIISGGMLASLYGWMNFVSQRFAYGIPGTERPTWLFLGVAAAAFVISLIAVRQVIRCRDDNRVLYCGLGFAVLFRLFLLPSEPIQEVDIYRYLWDGRVVCAGVNPYRHSPRNVIDSIHRTTRSPQLGQLTRIVEQSENWREVLNRVHFKELTTVYPPVSQAVFATAVLLNQEGDIQSLILTMKAVIVGFDVVACCLMFLLLRSLGMHGGWFLAYAWNPLVLKEFANSGHLDAIAIALTLASALTIVRQSAISKDSAPTASRGGMAWAATFLALGVGAKLYPIVLAPIITLYAKRRWGIRNAIVFSVCFVVAVSLAMLPWLSAQAADEVPTTYDAHGDVIDSATVESTDPQTGIAAFMTRWKMNDFLFLIVSENLEPNTAAIPIYPWFVFTPDNWRWNVTQSIHNATGIEFWLVPFLLARIVTSTIFLGIALWVAHRKTLGDPRDFSEGLFLTLAWFWLTLPTQNPWYWLWALPFLPLARSRAWWAMSGLVFVYYLRFWFKVTWPSAAIQGTPYAGAAFFDYVVTWIEYGPWFLALAISFWMQRRTQLSPTTIGPDHQECSLPV